MPTPTSDLVADLDAVECTDTLGFIEGHYCVIPIRTELTDPDSVILLQFDRQRCRYSLLALGTYAEWILECNRSELADWFGSETGRNIVATLLAEDPRFHFDGPIATTGNVDPSLVDAISPDAVRGDQFWGTVEFDLPDYRVVTSQAGEEPTVELAIPGSIIVEFALAEPERWTVELTITIDANHEVTFSLGQLSWRWQCPPDTNLATGFREQWASQWHRENTQRALEADLDGSLQVVCMGADGVDLVEMLDPLDIK